MFKIGNVIIEGKVVLGPMAGVTSFAFRKFFAPFGSSLNFTEMISDCGLIYGNEETKKYLPQKGDLRPIALQLFGGETSTLVKAVEIVEKLDTDYDILDLNLGCPVPKVTRTNGGSAWLKDLVSLSEMLKAVVAASSKPVSVKIRLGWDEESINFKDTLKIIEEAGVSAVALHLRTTKQMYTGKARYDLARDIGKYVNIPLIISGDMFTLDDAINALQITSADAVMVARGVRGKPMLLKQIDHYFKTGERLPDATLPEQIDYLLDFAKELMEEKGEKTAIANLRGLATHFINGFDEIKHIKRQISSLESFEHLKQLLLPLRDTSLVNEK